MGNSLAVQPGAVVQVAHRAAGNREVVDVLDAEVVSVDPYEGLPVFRLRTPDGQPMLPGDSGGGVWLDGKLVGNLWATFPKVSSPVDILPFVDPQAAEQGYRDLSLAARFPMKLDRLLRDMVRIDDSIE